MTLNRALERKIIMENNKEKTIMEDIKEKIIDSKRLTIKEKIYTWKYMCKNDNDRGLWRIKFLHDIRVECDIIFAVSSILTFISVLKKVLKKSR